MDTKAVFKLSYGVFFLGSHDGEKSNISVVNTVAQVTQEPMRISVTVLKSNYICDIIMASNQFCASVMGINASMDTIAHFGGQSGRNVDKLAGQSYKLDSIGNPYIYEGCIATLSCKVIQQIDLDTHMLFIADMVDGECIADEEPMTYKDYRDFKSGIKEQGAVNAPVNKKEVWQCTICHHIYDGDVPFEELPDDYECPICHQPKSAFERV